MIKPSWFHFNGICKFKKGTTKLCPICFAHLGLLIRHRLWCNFGFQVSNKNNNKHNQNRNISKGRNFNNLLDPIFFSDISFEHFFHAVCSVHTEPCSMSHDWFCAVPCSIILSLYCQLKQDISYWGNAGYKKEGQVIEVWGTGELRPEQFFSRVMPYLGRAQHITAPLVTTHQTGDTHRHTIHFTLHFHI